MASAVHARARPRTSTRGVSKPSLVSKHTSADSVRQHYQDVRNIGTGSFGSVVLVRERVTGHERVCKTVNIAGMARNLVDLMKKEIELLSILDHPGVVKLYEFAEDEKTQQLLLILEYLPGGSCDSLVKPEKSPPSEKLVARLIHQLLTSLEYCHAQGIVHRDIKPENMMLTQDVSAWSTPNCKLIDFGLADSKPKQDLLVGTVAYIAPEIIRFEQHTPKVDLWSVGVTAFELLSGKLPFGKPTEEDAKLGLKNPVLLRILDYDLDDFSDLVEEIFDDESTHWWQRRSVEARDFLRSLMHPDPAQRPTAAEALEHPWLQMHEPEVMPLTQEIVQSLAAFANAPPIARCCLHIIAARLCIPDIETIGGFFTSADQTGNGLLSKDEISEAIEDVQTSWFLGTSKTHVDIDGLVDAADFDHRGGIGYTGFIAACIYARQGSMEELARRAFYAMDSDRDGTVNIADIRQLFRERDSDLLASLPKEFNQNEWCACVDSHIRKSKAPKHTHRRVRSCV